MHLLFSSVIVANLVLVSIICQFGYHPLSQLSRREGSEHSQLLFEPVSVFSSLLDVGLALVTGYLAPLFADLCHDFSSGPMRVSLFELVSLLLAVENVGTQWLLGLPMT